MMEIHAVHGFLGLPSDWERIQLPQLYTYDLTKDPLIPATDGFWGWAKRFNAHARSTNGILLGYSLGGRLVQHALLENPSQWKAGIIVSSHTGYKTEKEKIARIQNDYDWAERFENEPWDKVLKAWNSQPVFQGIDYPLNRSEHLFSRQNLAQQLRFCSRGYQDDLFTAIQEFSLPLLWICGDLDIQFKAAAKELNFTHPLSRVEIVKGAAHRVPWEQPEKFLRLTQSFIGEVSSCI